LNNEILIATAILDQSIAGELIIWYHPRGRSKKGVVVEIDGSDRIGNRSRIEIVPNSPA
jgi:hypothetical protein